MSAVQIRELAKQRLLRKVRIDKNGCWLWMGVRNLYKGKLTYGRIRFQGVTWVASRLSFYLFRRDIPFDMQVCHTCDVPHCINPDHLFLGTRVDNYQDSKQKGRTFAQSKTHCINGHLLSEDNLVPNQKWRTCKICNIAKYTRANRAKRAIN